MQRNLPDWIEGWLSYTDNTEPPKMFHLWVAISTIASALQRKCYLEWGSITVYPNLYVVLVAPPGACRKGTAMAPARKILKQLGIKIASESLTREFLIRELSRASYSDADTSKGIISPHSSLTIFSEELTVFIGYQNRSLLTDLINWFDCPDDWAYRTKNSGEDEITGVWVNLIGATTPDLIQTAMPYEAHGGGLTSRIIFIYEDSKYRTVPFPFPTKEEINLHEKLVQDLGRINMLSGSFTYTENYMKRWAEWYEAFDKDNIFKGTKLAPYAERKPIHVMKLSMVLSASRSSDMIITETDIDRALSILAVTEDKMPKVLSGVGRSPVSDIISKVIALVMEKGEINRGELMRVFINDVDSRTMDNIIHTLEVSNYITVVNGSLIRWIKK